MHNDKHDFTGSSICKICKVIAFETQLFQGNISLFPAHIRQVTYIKTWQDFLQLQANVKHEFKNIISTDNLIEFLQTFALTSNDFI